jgi:hypothetical protein
VPTRLHIHKLELHSRNTDGYGLAAVETVNRPGDHMLARRILARPPALTPADARQAGFDLKTWEQGRTLARTA